MTGAGLKTRIWAMALLFAACVAVSGPARAEAVRELVTLLGAPPLRIDGIGIVTGLSNTGDKRPAAQETLRKYLNNNRFNFDSSSLALGNIALVRVTAEVPPFSRPGSTYAVTVTSIGDAKSLKGGELLTCDLFYDDPEMPIAQASGQVIVGTDSLTRGKVLPGDNSGALQIDLYPYGGVVNDEGWIRLNLKRPNWSDAATIARQINQTPALNPYLQEVTMFADADPTQPVAYAVDSGQVVVIIPGLYRRRVSEYIEGILQVPVAVDRPARIVVNRARNSIVVTGDIRVSNAVVSLQDKMVTIRPETPEEPARYTLENDTARNLVELDGPGTYADLQGLIDTLNAMGLTTDQVITIFEQLRSAGAINADFINE